MARRLRESSRFSHALGGDARRASGPDRARAFGWYSLLHAAAACDLYRGRGVAYLYRLNFFEVLQAVAFRAAADADHADRLAAANDRARRPGGRK